MEKNMDEALWSIKMTKYFKVNGLKIKKKEKDQKNFRTNVSFQVTMRMESQMEKVFINGLMDKLTKESGMKGRDMALGIGEGPTETSMKVHGKMESLMDQEHIYLKMEISLKDSLDNPIKMVLEYRNLRMETCIEVDI